MTISSSVLFSSFHFFSCICACCCKRKKGSHQISQELIICSGLALSQGRLPNLLETYFQFEWICKTKPIRAPVTRFLKTEVIILFKLMQVSTNRFERLRVICFLGLYEEKTHWCFYDFLCYLQMLVVCYRNVLGPFWECYLLVLGVFFINLLLVISKSEPVEAPSWFFVRSGLFDIRLC